MIFVRNVKFSAAECNSFNMRKKNVEDLASKQISGGSHAKKQPLGCKVATFGVQSYTHHGAKLQLSECKVTNIKMQFQIFRFQLSIFSNHQRPTLHQKASRCFMRLVRATSTSVQHSWTARCRWATSLDCR